MDTKWKSVRESRGFKALCVVLSMVLAFSSVALLSAVMRISGLYNNDAFTDPTVAKEGSLVQTTLFQSELDAIVNDIALLAGQKQLQQKVAALKKAKADSVAAALEQYKKPGHGHSQNAGVLCRAEKSEYCKYRQGYTQL